MYATIPDFKLSKNFDFETEFHSVALTGLKLKILLSSPLSAARITGMCNHV